jgi:glycosyltransferase involved in cell wall biosynthesis/2-polyprenyl-3-methyl-5-hydroxy-6-metoxy-1,4-benzoquinol methylase
MDGCKHGVDGMPHGAAAPAPPVPRLVWTPELAEQFWRAAYLHDLPPARVPRRTARHLAAVLAQRIPAAAQIFLLGERDTDYAAALLLAGFRVGRIDTGPLLRGSVAGLEAHPAWLGVVAATQAAADLVLVPESLAQVTDDEVDGLFATARMALRPAGQLVVTVPNNEMLDQFLSLCPASGTLFHMAQRLRAFSPHTLDDLLTRRGFEVAAMFETQLDETGFQSLGAHRQALATEPRLHFGDGGTLLAVASLQGGMRPDDAAGSARWLHSRHVVGAAMATPEPAEWIWTPVRVADFWSRIAGTPMDALSFGATQGPALLTALEPWLVPGGRHLDIGSGEGEMARVMAGAGYAVAVLEPSPGRQRLLTEKLQGASGYLGAFETIDADNVGSFDVAMAIEVIEHVLEDGYGEFFATLDRSLAPGGRVILTTPNREDLDRSLMVSPLAGILYHRWQHVRSFDGAALAELLAQYGFAVELMHEVDVSALAAGASPFAALALTGSRSVRLGSGSTLIAIAHRIGERPAPPGDPLTLVSRTAQQQPPAPRVIAALPNSTLSAGRSTARPVPAALVNARVRRVLRPLVRAARPVARRLLPMALKQRVARLVAALEVQQGDITARRFAERPVMLCDLPPLLGPQAFADGPIILVNNALAWGGAERQLVTTLRSLDGRTGKPLGLLCMRLGAGPDYDFFVPALQNFDGILRNAIDIGEARRLLAAAAPADALARARTAIGWLPNEVQDEIERLAGDFAQLRPAVVHAWQDSLSIAAAYAARIVGVPRVIVSARNVSPPNFAYHRPYMANAYREVASIPEIVMLNNSAAGAADYASWLGLPGNRIRVLRNGIDPGAFIPPAPRTRERLRAALGIPETAPVIGSVFRLYDEKQPLLWVETAALVARARPDCHFVIVGAGPLRGAVLKRAHQGGFAERLHCPGTSAEASGYLSIFDVFLLTSRAEGTPNVVLEASLAGVPVVATAAGGTAETIDDGVTGLLVRDASAATLAARLLEVLDDAAWRESVEEAGPAFVNRCFGLERMVEETLAVYGP